MESWVTRVAIFTKADRAEVALPAEGVLVDPLNGPWAVVVVDEGDGPRLATVAEQDLDATMRVLVTGCPTDAVAYAVSQQWQAVLGYPLFA
jgi:hypothetical protein